MSFDFLRTVAAAAMAAMAAMTPRTTHEDGYGGQEVPERSYESSTPYQREQYQPRSERVSPRPGLVTPDGGVVLHCEGAIIDTIDGVAQEGENKHGLSQLAMIDIESGETVLNTYCYYPSNATPLIKAHLPPQGTIARHDGIHPSVNTSNPSQAFYGLSNSLNGALPVGYVLQSAEIIIEKAGFIVGHGLADLQKMLRPLDLDRWDQCDTQVDPENQSLTMGFYGPHLRLKYHQILTESSQHGRRDALMDAERTKRLYTLAGTALVQQQQQQLEEEQQAQRRDEEAKNDESESYFDCVSTAPGTINSGELSVEVTADRISGPASNLRGGKRRHSQL